LMTTWNGADRVPASHPLYFGRPNTWGQRSANLLLQQADVLIALGTRLVCSRPASTGSSSCPSAGSSRSTSTPPSSPKDTHGWTCRSLPTQMPSSRCLLLVAGPSQPSGSPTAATFTLASAPQKDGRTRTQPA